MFIVTEYAALKGGYTGSSESTLVKMFHCWKSHVVAHILLQILANLYKHENTVKHNIHVYKYKLSPKKLSLRY